MTIADQILWRRTLVEMGLIVPADSPAATEDQRQRAARDENRTRAICQSKSRYPNEAKAQRVADRATCGSGWRITVYQCRVCAGISRNALREYRARMP